MLLLVILVVDAARLMWRFGEGLLDVFTMIFTVVFMWLFLISQGVVGRGRRGAR